MNMQALVIEKPRAACVRSVPVPPVGEQDILIEVKASGICGTDAHIFRGEYLGTYPVIPGHEFSGVVAEAGAGVTRFVVGDRAAVEPNLACGICPPCLSNRQNFCGRWSALGVTRPGGMAAYAAVPEQAAFKLEKNLSFLEGAFMEPLSCVLHGLERAPVRFGDRVLVVGAGPMGLLLTQAACLHGAGAVTQVDRNQSRLERAQENGASQVRQSLEGLPQDSFDLVVDATGVPALMARAVDFARKGGAVLWFGAPPRDGKLELPAFSIFEKGLSLVSSYTSARNSLQALALLETGKIRVSPLVSHTLPLADFARAVELIETGRDNVLKVMILPDSGGL
ncbi:MAG: zinc-dependent alcohol dehydrogenase family protein [Spirochaetaceae bacterium]|jgi:2-desacetyl-2-hydroxyethyl bacteriochlorophyllide A dehydrogenase|nr:zinc-dependent alcohol dehydrogenase family protein [Spirochaetaceae bacterium]